MKILFTPIMVLTISVLVLISVSGLINLSRKKGRRSSNGSTGTTQTKTSLWNSYTQSLVVMISGLLILFRVANEVFPDQSVQVWNTATEYPIVALVAVLALFGITYRSLSRRKKGDVKGGKGFDAVPWAVMLVAIIGLSVLGSIAFGFLHLKTEVEAKRLDWAQKVQAKNAPREIRQGERLVTGNGNWSNPVIIPNSKYVFEDEIPPHTKMFVLFESLKDYEQQMFLVSKNQWWNPNTMEKVPSECRGLKAPIAVKYTLSLTNGSPQTIKWRLIPR